MKIFKINQWNVRVTVITIGIGEFGPLSKGLKKQTEGVGNRRKNREHQNVNIASIGLYIHKSLGDLKRLVIHSPGYVSVKYANNNNIENINSSF